jgi:hypothetical protein
MEGDSEDLVTDDGSVLDNSPKGVQDKTLESQARAVRI